MPETLPALAVDGVQVPALTLTRAVRDLTADLRAHRVGPGRLVALTGPSPFQIVVAVLAAERLAAPLALSPGWPAVDPPAWAVIGADGAVRRRRAPYTPVPTDTALVLWTSGSTGLPRAAALGRAAIGYQGRATADRLRIGPDDRLLLPLPLHHAYGMSVLHAARSVTAQLYVEKEFGVTSLIRRITNSGITSMDAVPTMYRILGREAARDEHVRRALAGLRLRGCGGDVLTPMLRGEFERRTGARLHDGYGLTEAGPNVAINAPHDYREGTVGRPLDGTQVRTDAETGEIQVSGPGLMLGYLDLATGEVDRGAFTADAWLRTGDLGRLDGDGYLSVTGRSKSVLTVQGETIAPSVLEDVMRRASGVGDVAVVGYGGGARGDRVVVFVEHDPAAEALAVRARLLELCRAGLPPVFRPHEIHFVDELPRTASGKLDRTALAARL